MADRWLLTRSYQLSTFASEMKVIALFCSLVHVIQGGRILAILPHFGVTHWISFRPLVEELAIRGHDVTVVTPFLRDAPLKNYREISIASSYPKTMEYVSFEDMENIYRYSVMELYPLYYMAQMTESTFEREEVLALANENFDLVITELFNTEIYHALAYKIKAPVVSICSHQITGWGTYVLSTPDVPSHVAHSLAYRSAPFTFLDRLLNILELIVAKTVYLFVFIPSSQKTAEKHLGKLPDVSELCQNTSLVFLNAHFSINNPRPHNPNVIEVGGINVVPPKPLPAVFYFKFFVPRAQKTAEQHLGPLPKLSALEGNASLILVNAHFTLSNPRPLNPNVIEVGGINVVPPNPLSDNLQQILDRSKDGVIYFSMGTVLKASTLTETKRAAFVKAFAALKQTVLWKWDVDMKDKPQNVHLSTWFPQRDLFAHKNLVLFISHCGNLGVNEAVHEGIPIICIPMFGDQPYNSKSVESQGMGEVLDFYSDITFDRLKSTINRVLTNPSYKRNARRVSKAYRDRPMSPLHTAVYWVEYVLRHEGAYHLRSAARHMPWYAYHNYDVMVFLHAALAAVLYLLYKVVFLFVKCLSFCCKSKPKGKFKKS